MAVFSSQRVLVETRGVGETPRYRPALVSLAVLYFMMGFITCLNDSLVPFFKAGFRLSYAQSSLVQFYFFLTYAVLSIPAGRLVERVGFKRGMVLGFLIAAFGALLFLPASVFHVYALFLAALFILAAGIVLLQVSANPYITVLGSPETASSRLALIQGVGSIGTTIAPLFGATFILGSLRGQEQSSAAVRLPYLAIGGCLLVIALVVAKLRLPVIGAGSRSDEGAPTGGEARRAGEAWKAGPLAFRNLRFGIPAIFLYVGAEVSIGTFLTAYISDKIQVPVDIANNYVAFYWGGMLAGRLAGAVILRNVRPSVVLSWLSLLAVALIGISLSTTGVLAVWTLIAVGVCNSVMFAVIFSLSLEGVGGYVTRASGLLSTAIAGGAVISFFQGVLKDSFSWLVAFLVPVVCYGYLFFFGVNGYRTKRRSR